MKLINTLLAIALAWAVTPLVAAQSIDLIGLWEHTEEPVIIEMKPLDEGIEGIVYRNDSKPESVGKRIFRDLRFDKEKQCWQGFVYVLKLEKEMPTCVALESVDRFSMTVKVGFFSKTVVWRRSVIEGDL